MEEVLMVRFHVDQFAHQFLVDEATYMETPP